MWKTSKTNETVIIDVSEKISSVIFFPSLKKTTTLRPWFGDWGYSGGAASLIVRNSWRPTNKGEFRLVDDNCWHHLNEIWASWWSALYLSPCQAPNTESTGDSPIDLSLVSPLSFTSLDLLGLLLTLLPCNYCSLTLVMSSFGELWYWREMNNEIRGTRWASHTREVGAVAVGAWQAWDNHQSGLDRTHLSPFLA